MWPRLVAERRPDAVIVATGAEPARPWWAPPEAEHVVDVRDVLDGSPAGGGPAEGEPSSSSTSSASTTRRRWPSCWPTAAATVEVVTNGMVVGQDLGITLDMEGWWMRATAKGIVQTTDLVPMGVDGRTLHLLHHPTGAMQDADAGLGRARRPRQPGRVAVPRAQGGAASASSGSATASRPAGPTPRSSRASGSGAAL